MTTFFRHNRYCSELDRTAEELLEFAARPRALQQARMGTHQPATVDCYVRSCALFAAYCRARGRPALLKTPARAADVVLDFLRDCHENQGWKSCTIRAALTAINTWYVTRDLPRPESRQLRAFCAALRKAHATVRATPITVEQVKAACRHAARTRSKLVASRDISMLTFAFLSADRSGEVRNFAVEWIVQRDSRGMVVAIPHSKGAPNDPQYVTITPARDPLYCPVRRLEAWLELSGITEGIVFRRIDRHGKIGPDRPISDTAYQTIVRYYLDAVGLKGKRSGYCMRRGYATTAWNYGASGEEIQQQLRHKLRVTTDIYIERQPIPYSRSITGVLLS